MADDDEGGSAGGGAEPEAYAGAVEMALAANARLLREVGSPAFLSNSNTAATLRRKLSSPFVWRRCQ